MYYLKNSCTFSFIVVLFSLLVTNDAAQLQPRIAGGSDAKIGEFPYIVFLLIKDVNSCGGTILSNTHILTAAHCVNDWKNSPQYLCVQYGVVDIDPDHPNGPNVVSVKSIKVHEKFDIDSFAGLHDIAVLELADEINFGLYVSPVSLPDLFEDPVDNSVAAVAGWGIQHDQGYVSPHLQKDSIHIFSNEYCLYLDDRYDADSHICGGVRFGWHGPCKGDSGGPLIVNGKQLGIVSWADRPCGSPAFPVFFTRVSTYRKWINKWSGV